MQQGIHDFYFLSLHAGFYVTRVIVMCVGSVVIAYLRWFFLYSNCIRISFVSDRTALFLSRLSRISFSSLDDTKTNKRWINYFKIGLKLLYGPHAYFGY